MEGETLYLNPEGDPLWMSFGRNSKELIPTCTPVKIEWES